MLVELSTRKTISARTASLQAATERTKGIDRVCGPSLEMLRTRGAKWYTERESNAKQPMLSGLQTPQMTLCSEKQQHPLSLSFPPLHHLLGLLARSADTSNLEIHLDNP